MSGSTVAGGSVAQQFTGSAAATLSSFFGSGTPFTVLPPTSGAFTASGPVVVAAPNLALTLSGATAVADTSTGGTSITTTTPSTVFAAPNDTITSAAATTLFGASGGGIDHFSISGANSSITGGTGSIVGTASGSNSTLVGGTGISIFNVTGPNSLAVAGSAGVTGINEQASTGPETIATNPLGNSGTLVAILGSGADTVIGGSGASTITGGSGDDVFAFIKGHAGGSEVIIGFNASDNLAFAGYGYTATNLPTEAVGSVGDVLTLNDGTTITLAGVDHKIFS
jgi:RTX calcium-binding nonapeptide repeat (4 copies)